jgi:hypothetical protein
MLTCPVCHYMVRTHSHHVVQIQRRMAERKLENKAEVM